MRAPAKCCIWDRMFSTSGSSGIVWVLNKLQRIFMTLRVVSWNIHKGRDFLGRRVDVQHSLDLMAKQEWDVCCLQEVPRGAIQSFSHRTGMPFAYGFTRAIRGDHVGNAILIRQGEIGELDNLDISAHAIESRGALFARVTLPGQEPVIVSSTHFGLTRKWRVNQARELVRFIEQSSRASSCESWSRLVIGGDFNDHAKDVASVMRLHGFSSPCHKAGGRSLASFPAIAPMMSLDCIYIRGGEVGVGVIPSKSLGWHRHSDHSPIAADVDFVPAAPGQGDPVG